MSTNSLSSEGIHTLALADQYDINAAGRHDIQHFVKHSPSYRAALLGHWSLQQAIAAGDLSVWGGHSPEEVTKAWVDIGSIIEPRGTAIVEQLRQTGAGVYLATKKVPERAARLREQVANGDIPAHGVIATSDPDIQALKTEPDFWHRACELVQAAGHDFRPDEAYVVDDDHAVIDTVRQLGMHVIEFTGDFGRLQHDLGLATT